MRGKGKILKLKITQNKKVHWYYVCFVDCLKKELWHAGTQRERERESYSHISNIDLQDILFEGMVSQPTELHVYVRLDVLRV